MSEEIKITLAAARVNAGLTQAEAAEKSGIKIDTIKNAELGKTDPRWSTVVALADLYGIPINHIIISKKSA